MLEQQPYINYTARDETGSYALMRFYVQSGISKAAGMAAATAFRSIVGDVTDTAIERQGLVYPVVIESPASPEGAVSFVGVFVFSTTEPGQFAIIEIPGIKESCLVSSGPGEDLLIDLENSAVEAFVDALISGSWCNRFGYQLLEVGAAFVQVRDI